MSYLGLAIFHLTTVLPAFALGGYLLLAIRRGDQKTHMQSMIMTYVGGILIAGSFALMPGRLLHDWLSG